MEVIEKLKNAIMYDRDLLPSIRDYQDLAEKFILEEYPSTDRESLTSRAEVVLYSVMAQLEEESEQISHMHGAPLPVASNLKKKFNSEEPAVQNMVWSIYQDFLDDQGENDLPFPFIFYFQQVEAVKILEATSDGTKIAVMVEGYYPDPEAREWVFSMSEEGTLIKVTDGNGDAVDNEIIGEIYSEYVLPMQNLGYRVYQVAAIEEEAGDDLDEMMNIESVQDLLGDDI